MTDDRLPLPSSPDAAAGRTLGYGYGGAGIYGRRAFPISSASIQISGSLTKEGLAFLMGEEDMEEATTRDMATDFMDKIGLVPTPDAVDQLVEVFIPCLRIMCERGYDPDGMTWKSSGRFGALHDVRMKFERLWERAWIRGEEHVDSAFDLINYTGFYLRNNLPRWGRWGEPGKAKDDNV